MIGNKILLDTSIVIEFLDNNKIILDRINKFEGLFISSIVLGELYIGVNRVTDKAKHLNKLSNALKLCSTLIVDSPTAMHYGEITAALFRKGKPIPTNDVWIAASAIQHDLTLITMDKHFNEIDGLKMEIW